MAAGDRRPAYLLALLLVWTPEEIDLGALGDPVAKAAAWAAAGRQITRVEFQLLIESVDQLYLRAKTRGAAAVNTFLEASLPMFDSLALLPGLSPRQIAELHHHRGKTYRRLYRDADARREFETVMAGSFPLDATRLQLIRVYKRSRDFELAARLGEEVLSAAEDTGVVSPSVLLAVIQDLPWLDASVRRGLLWPRQSFIEQTIIHYANAGLIKP